MARPNPSNWNDYQYGTLHSNRSNSVSERSVRFEEHDGTPSQQSEYLDFPTDGEDSSHGVRRRRSSIAVRLNSLTHAGGVNSIENFARSWTRAAGFLEVTPQRPSFILTEEGPADRGEDDIEYGRIQQDNGRLPRTSLLREHLDRASPQVAVDEASIVEEESDPTTPRPLNHKESEGRRLGTDFDGTHYGSARESQSIFAISPHLATPLAGSYGTSYGTLRSSLTESSMVHAGQLWKQQQAERANLTEGDHMPLIVREVEQDGKIVLVVEGQSTLPQTIFNSTNVLIGVGLLSLPMGLKYSGWLCGMIFLLLSAVVTAYTATLLTKCMDRDRTLITFADLAFASYGQKARIVTSILFTLELLAACVALVVLFADTLHILMPSVGVNFLKISCGVFLIPLNFLPLRLLSFSSVIGIFSCLCIILIIFIDGFTKHHTPGSLIEPAKQYLFPSNWLTLPLSFGLLMSPWGGHSVFPNIYRDMRHPQKFKKAVKITFSFTYLLDMLTAVAGILMFGDGVMDEITANIIGTSGYPRSLSILMTIFIGIIPLTKLPLNARPIVSTVEVFCGLDARAVADSQALVGLSSYSRGFIKFGIRICVIVIFVITAIIFPAFDSIMAFMGSSLCFTICVILPLLFYLKMFGKEVSRRERALDYVLIFISSILAVVGTIFAFLPKKLIGAE